MERNGTTLPFFIYLAKYDETNRVQLFKARW
jgi:hypothetical protein